MRNLVLFTLLALALAGSSAGAAFEMSTPAQADRVWIGPEYWANPLQDWRVRDGRIECAVSGQNRNVNLLTHQLSKSAGAFTMSVRLSHLEWGARLDPGWAGFRLGIDGPIKDYRYAALRGHGLNAGVTTTGKPFIGDEQAAAAFRRRDRGAPVADVVLRLSATPRGEQYEIVLSIHDPASGKSLRRAKATVPAAELAGNIALVSEWTPDLRPSSQNSYGRNSARRGGNVRFWFRDWKASGDKIEVHPERAWGPILWSQYTLSKGVMKMTAQMPPLGVTDAQTVALQIKPPGASGWKTIDQEQIHTLARTATFRIANWDATKDIPYRLVYQFTRPNYWEGTVRHDPVEKDSIAVAGFTGNEDTGFPNTPTVNNIKFLDPDVLFFSGDQIYESVAGYGIERAPVATATLDYLRKWWLFGWSFGDLMRDRPAVIMPDDHDVYQGNIWGDGGRKQTIQEHERGGYVMPAEWVNAVQRTQTAHLPDPYDARPVAQGIGVYYTDMLYGGVSFGIIEDRKFKSGPKGIVPDTGGRPDHITDPNFDRDAYDPPGATIFGERQIAFIRDWTADWRGAFFKVSLTQTILSNAATTHGGNFTRLVADLDSNGWPRSARNRALRELRKGFAFMYAGDQHLPSLIHQGVEEWNDSGWSFCVPSIAAGYPRLYEPNEPGRNRQAGMPSYTGEHVDGLGNKMTIWAVANPKKKWRKNPLERLMDKDSGYGIVRFNKRTGEITVECWPILVDASQPDAKQFTGWPKTIPLEDNFAKKAVAWLPTLKVTGMEQPVVQVVEESTGETVYTLRVYRPEYHPRVFTKTGTYTLRVGEPGQDFREFHSLHPATAAAAKTIEIAF